MKNVLLTITSNEKIGKDIYLMRLSGDCSEIKNPGEFINILLPNHYLRRPISVCDYASDHVDILFKVLGHGTNDMSAYKCGMVLDCLIGLGNGFTINSSIKPVLVAGGIGIAPLIGLAKKYNLLGIKPILIYGARSSDDIVNFPNLNEYCETYYCTDDGSMGFKGNVVEFVKSLNLDISYYYSCGPYRMLEALAKNYPNGCVSLEARMGCGFGACMGCSIKTVNGPKRVCKEGPVFDAKEVIF
ncbi:MAG: dihydroorotate dehydrogenase electron transfer subunit [Anaeroplasma sp.]